MSLISGWMGHASEVDVAKLQKEFGPFLVEDESLVAGYQLVRDLLVFTNKRLILVDKQGVTSKKTEYMTIPYTSICVSARRAPACSIWTPTSSSGCAGRKSPSSSSSSRTSTSTMSIAC